MNFIMKIKIFIVFAVTILLFSSCIFAQGSSSYARAGIGDLTYSYSARGIGLGEGGVALSDRDFVNTINPAGWNRLRLTRMEFGLNLFGRFVSDDKTTSFYSKGNFSGFTMAFPISTTYGIGVAAGIVPYSFCSYKVKDKNNESDLAGKYEILYKGDGGISKAFLGSSFRLFNDLNLGATLEYYFGKINYTTEVSFVDASSAIVSYHEKEIRPKGMGTTLGLITPDLSSLLKVNAIKELKVGFTASLVANLKTDSLMLAHSENTYDTVGYNKVDMNIPTRFNVGLSMLLHNNYQLYADYMMQSWSDYTIANEKSENLRNLSKITAGFEYKPPREVGATALEQMQWRAAVGYEQTYYTFNGVGINEYFAAGGFSYPLSPENTLDFGVLGGVRGTKDSGLLKESFVRVTIGFSLGELWFVRQDK